MQKIIILFFISIFSLSLMAQDKESIAKLHYTNAEAYYNSGSLSDLDNCVQELTDAERALGATHSKILYLKIKAMWNDGIVKDGYYAYDIDTCLKKFFSITSSSNYPGDKYAEIIKVNEDFSRFKNLEKNNFSIWDNPSYKLKDSALITRILVVSHNGFKNEKLDNNGQYIGGDTDSFYKYALLLNRELYKRGNIIAINNLALMCFYGEGIKKSDDSAIFWFKKAADKQNVTAMEGLGEAYWDKFFYMQSPDDEKGNYLKESVKWLNMAIQNGSRYAKFLLGKIYCDDITSGRWLEGSNKEKYEKGLQLLTEAANAGSRSAMQELSVNYKFGAGKFSKDKKLSAEWQAKADAAQRDYGVLF